MGTFSWGGGGGEEETPGYVQDGRFFAGRHEFPNSPFYVTYYILNSGVFTVSYVRPSQRCPRSSMTSTDMCVVQVSTTRRPLPHTEDSEGPDVPRSTTDSTDQWVWCPIHIRSMLHVISVTCLGLG